MAELHNIQQSSQQKKISTIFWFIVRQSWQDNKWVFMGAVVMTLILASFSFLNSFSFGQVVNILTSEGPAWSKMIPYLVLIILLDYLPGIFGFIDASFSEFINRKLRMNLEQKIFRKISDLDIATIEQPAFQDMLYQVQSRGVSGIININAWLFTLIRQVFRLFLAIAILFSFSKMSIVIIVMSTLPVYFYEKWRGKNLAKIIATMSETNRKSGSKVAAFTNRDSLVEVKFFSIASYFLKKIKGIRNENHEFLVKDDIKTTPWYALSQLVPAAGIAFIAISFIQQVIIGTLAIGSLTFIWGTLWSFSASFQSIIRSLGRLEEPGIHASKLLNLLEMNSFLNENKRGKGFRNAQIPAIEFNNVSFKYPGTDRYVLQNVSVTFQSGLEIAIVGLNGAGKTTFLRLLTRVYDPTEGEILVDGINLKEYSLDAWRNMLSIMLQDYTVYHDESIKENITFAHNEKVINHDYLHQVVQETGVADFTDTYANGLDQMIGKEYRGGVELSKGQRQKVVLARTLYQNRPILVLDEPTSAVDALSEDRIFKALRENHRDQTRVIISHKFSNVRQADKIILIEHGQIIEEGSHEELMEKNGKYAELFMLQAEGYK